MADKRIFLIAAVLVFLLFLLYLFFFNYGLIIQTEATPEPTAFIVNTSFHRIEEIQIFINNNLVMSDFSLEPGQRKEIPLIIGKNTILAKAKNHLSAEEIIFKQEKTPDLSYLFEIPELIRKDENFKISVLLCNKTNIEKQVEIEVLFDTNKIQNSFEKINIQISGNNCSEQEFEFIPITEGKLKIYFILSLGEYTETIIKEIEVI